MKALFLVAALATVGSPVMAGNGWGHPSGSYGNCGSSYQRSGRTGYDPYLGGRYGMERGHGYSTRDPWAYRSFPPSGGGRATYDPVHGDFHPNANAGYGSSFSRSRYEGRFHGHGGY